MKTKNELLNLDIFDEKAIVVVIKTKDGGHYVIEAHASDGYVDFTYSNLNTLFEGLKSDGGIVEPEIDGTLTLDSVLRETSIDPESIVSMNRLEIGA